MLEKYSEQFDRVLFTSSFESICLLLTHLVVKRCPKFSILIIEEYQFLLGSKGALAKVALDQSLFAPAFIVVFITAASTLNGLTTQVIFKLVLYGFVFLGPGPVFFNIMLIGKNV